MKLRIWILACLCICCTLGSATIVFGKDYTRSQVTSDKRLLLFENTIAELYKHSNAYHKQEVYRLLQSLKHQLEEPLLLKHGTAEGWKMIKQDVLAVETALISDKPGVVWREPVNRLRLAADSLMQAEHGPWLQYEALLLDELKNIRRSSRLGSESATEMTSIYVNKLFERMGRMEVAAYMVGDQQLTTQLFKRAQLLKSFMLAHQQGWNQEQQKQLMTIADDIELAVHALFAQAETTITVPVATVPSGINTTSIALLIGALITGVLTFTSYRKYKQEPYGVKEWRM